MADARTCEMASTQAPTNTLSLNFYTYYNSTVWPRAQETSQLYNPWTKLHWPIRNVSCPAVKLTNKMCKTDILFIRKIFFFWVLLPTFLHIYIRIFVFSIKSQILYAIISQNECETCFHHYLNYTLCLYCFRSFCSSSGFSLFQNKEKCCGLVR